MLATVLLICFIILLVAAFPTWPHSRKWGYYPFISLGLVIGTLVILIFMERM